jgi:RHS repeat-associated protein
MSATIDSLGRLISSQKAALAATTVSYDSRGRLASMTRGSGSSARSVTFIYGADGFLQSTTDSIGRIAQFTHDAVGRIVSKTFPGGATAQFAYDAAGNMTSITPPGRPAHTFTYSDRDELLDVIPPAVAGTGPTHYTYNVDGQPTTVARPDGASVTFGYDTGGRFASRAFAQNGTADGTDGLVYDSVGRLAQISTGNETTTYTYNGALLVGKTWAGPVAGSLTTSYDTNVRISSESVNGGSTINFTYDNDDLLVAAGGLAIAHDPQNGLATGTSLGSITTSVAYNNFGEVTGYTAKANGTPFFSTSLVRDAVGRVAQKTETIGGVTDTYTYHYDPTGALNGVSKNATSIETYVYDTTGNRISAVVNGSSIAASYDSQDRLSSYGTVVYSYTGAGDLATRSAGGQVTSYQYDVMGNLVGAALPNGTGVSYVIDGNSQRVGKKVNGALVKGFLYRDPLRIAAELDGAGALVSRFVYAGGSVPAAMIKGASTFRILTDGVGSVRLVVDTSNGTVVQRIDYDSFGNVILDTNPGFQPFGFAGGLYDADVGLVRFGYRDYEPATGRWTAKDPAGFAGGDHNLYRYVLNDPVNARDVNGLDGWDTATGFFEQANADLQLGANPLLLVDVLVDAGVRWAAMKLGADPRDPQMFGPIPPGYDHPPTLYEQMFRPPTTADRMSADYTKGELIAQCLGIVAGAVDLAAGLGSAASKVSSKLSRSAVERAADELALEVAERANAPKNLGAYAPEAKGPGLQWVRPEGGGAGTSSAGKGAGGFAGGR